MTVQRLGESLLRSRYPIYSFASLLSPVQCATRNITFEPIPSNAFISCKRCLTTRPSPLNAATTAGAQPEAEAESTNGSTTQSSEPTPATSPTPARRQTASDMLGELFLRSTADRPSGVPLRNANSRNTGQRGRNQPTYLRDRQGDLAKDMDFSRVSGGNLQSLSMQGMVSQDAMMRSTLSPLPAPVRLDAFVGRSEEINPSKGVDLGRALRSLEMKCRANSVRKDFNRQRFHERPGLKRKRLKSERWRRRFKLGFQAVVAKVKDMRRKGW